VGLSFVGHCQNNLPCTNGIPPAKGRKHARSSLASLAD
jgi:hypothetical protein